MDVIGNAYEDSGADLTYVGQPRIAKGLCVLGALSQKTVGDIRGQFGQLIPSSKDDENMSLNYYIDNEERHSNSKETSPMGDQGGYGLIPNFACGAPLSTFVFGGISPDEIHPVLNLIQGPPSSTKCKTFTGDSIPFYSDQYINFSFIADYGNFQTDIADDSGQIDANAYYVNNNPIIPPRLDTGITFNGQTINLYQAASPLSTYNIWKMRYPSRYKTATFNIENYIQYEKNFGPVIDFATAAAVQQAYDGPTINQALFATGSKVQISTPKDFVFVERLFPISYDLMYSNRNTNPIAAYYSLIKCDDGTIDAPNPTKVNMNGGINCGFQMDFKCSGIDQNYSTANGSVTPSIVINWGDQDNQPANVINKFQLIISGQGTELRYFNPTKQIANIATNEGTPTPVDTRWIRVNLKNGHTLKEDSQNFSVFIHYAGPYMYIGFGSGAAVNWDYLGPVDDDSNDLSNKKLSLQISEDATVAIGVGYMNCVFQYGPMAFKNYNNQRITNITSITNKEYLNYIDFSFIAPDGKQSYLDPKNIQNNFYNLAYTTPNDAKNKDTNMSFAPDWRSPIKNQFNFIWRVPPTLITTGAAQYNEVNPLFYTSGTLQYNTTFEGPVFFEITNNITPEIQANPPYIPLNVDASNRVSGNATNGTEAFNPTALIRNYSWGDISRYLIGWEFTCGTEQNTNSSYLGMNGTATFKDMALDPMGRKILTLIDGNKTVISLGAGYSSDYPVVFGQGVIESISTVRSSTGTVTTMKFKDVGTYLFENSKFKDPYIFSGMKYRRVIQSVLEIIGFSNYFSQRPDTADPNWALAVNLRASVSQLRRSIVAGAMKADINSPPLQVIKQVLSVMIQKNATPIMFWDCIDQLFRMEWRQAPEFIETLYFAGYNNAQDSLLPNTQNTDEDIANGLNRDWQHGVLVSDWTINSEFQNLIYKMIIYSSDAVGKLISYQRYVPNAISDVIWNKLNNLENINIKDIPTGYIGHELIRFATDSQIIFEDKPALYRFGDSLFDTTVGKTYQTINFKIYVTRPLIHWGRFVVQTFVGDNAVQTDPFYYKEVNYSFNKESNQITAEVKGESTPPLKTILGDR
jgi:hypothetical protein